MGSFLFVVEIWVKDIKFVSLGDFWRRIFLSVMRLVVPCPFALDSDPVDVLRLSIPKPALIVNLIPVIEFLFILLHPFVLLEFDNLLCNEVVSACGLIDYI